MKLNLLSLRELSRAELQGVLNLSKELKTKVERGEKVKPVLRGKVLAMLFQKPSTRTRLSFEVAMNKLGGEAMYLRWEDLQLARGETLADTAKTLSLYVQGIMARVFKHSDLEEMAKHSPVPVINGLSDLYHPCQTLADLLTILEKVGRVKGAKLAWVGDGNNVCNSLLIGCSILGINMMVACPPGYEPHKEAFEWAEKEARRTGCEISLVREPENAVKDADVVYTDTFVSMGMESEYEKRRSVFLPRYQVTPKLLSHAKKGAIFMHCLPAHRGEEVVSEVIDGPQSVVWEQASNRLYTTMGILSLLMHV